MVSNFPKSETDMFTKERQKVNRYGLLIDMDGVIYRGGEVIPGAVETIQQLVEQNIPFRFLTNNSQRTRLDLATKLRGMGFCVQPQHIYTCAIATARFIANQKENPTVYVLGESGLTTELHANGIATVDRDADFVVVGEGRTYTFEMLEHATNLVLDGARLIATNLDPNCPTANGKTRPGCGAVVSLLEKATGRIAFSPGKPSPVMMRDARKELELEAAQTFMIGDTMDTDIRGGLELGYTTVLVLTGGTKRHELCNFAFQPKHIVDSIAELNTDWFDAQVNYSESQAYI